MVLLTENHTELLFMLLLYLSSGPFVALFLSLNLSFVDNMLKTDQTQTNWLANFV